LTEEKRERLYPALGKDQIDCLVPYGHEERHKNGAVLFKEGEVGETFFVVLEGEVRVTKQVEDSEVILAVHGPGEFTGEAGALTGEPAMATAVAATEVRLLRLPGDRLTEAVCACPAVFEDVVVALAHRRPEAIAFQHNRDRLASLGTFAAGLAHEMNNPVSAAARSASQLVTALAEQRLKTRELLGGDPASVRLLERLDMAGKKSHCLMGALERSDCENALIETLEGLGLTDSGPIAGILVDSGFDASDLGDLVSGLSKERAAAEVAWLAGELTLVKLAADVQLAMERVSDVVEAVKGYSSLDEAPMKETSVHQGLENTLLILGHKLKAKNLVLEKRFDPDVETIEAAGGELNQVWTNLIDNAADALPEGGRIVLTTHGDRDDVVVEVEDNGPGIPPESIDNVFDPFFTSKEVGKGTGLGLDIAYRIVVSRHRGDLSVESAPGRTVFKVRLPRSQS
jgi:signal transduction histidine kinase